MQENVVWNYLCIRLLNFKLELLNFKNLENIWMSLFAGNIYAHACTSMLVDVVIYFACVLPCVGLQWTLRRHTRTAVQVSHVP